MSLDQLSAQRAGHSDTRDIHSTMLIHEVTQTALQYPYTPTFSMPEKDVLCRNAL